MSRPLADERAPRPVVASVEDFRGAVWSVRTDDVDLGEAGVVRRDYVEHPGAVAVLALDDEDRVLVVRQYRHPVRSLCWELPAGLRDVEGEPVLATARRELAEETGHAASLWYRLLRLHTSSGGSTETLEIFLARGVAPVRADASFEPEGEEVGIEVVWVPLDDLVAGVLAGRLGNASLVTGVLAAAAQRAAGWADLRDATDPTTDFVV